MPARPLPRAVGTDARRARPRHEGSGCPALPVRGRLARLVARSGDAHVDRHFDRQHLAPTGRAPHRRDRGAAARDGRRDRELSPPRTGNDMTTLRERPAAVTLTAAAQARVAELMSKAPADAIG